MSVSQITKVDRSPGRISAGIPFHKIASQTAGLFRNGWGLLFTVIVVCWLLFFLELRGEWEINPQYNYGYVVPLLCAALFWRRWPDRPTASLPQFTRPAAVLVCVLLFLYFPIRLFLEANPEWRLLYWANAFQVLGLSTCLLYRIGGWAWVRHFGPALLFSLIAVPWPMQLEAAVIQGLMKVVAGLTVDVVGLLGIPALQHGNVIEVTTGLVGIDEACSGVRSLQSGLMLSLFLGEMHRFSFVRRSWLLGASLVLVLFANLTRTSFLTWAAANRGISQMEAWHDTAGLLVMLIVLPGLLGLAYWMRPRSSKPLAISDQPIALPAISNLVGVVALVWLAGATFAVEAWYQVHERNLLSTTRWTVSWPSENQRFKKTVLPERSLAILRCSHSEAAAWEDAAANEWSAFFLRWDPGRNSAQLAKGHRPDTCFVSAGAKLLNDFGMEDFSVGTFKLPLRHQTFESNGTLIHAFYCLWPDRKSRFEETLLEDWSRASRVQAVIAGKRHLGQQALEIVVAGPSTQQQASLLLQSALPDLIRVEEK